MERDDVTESLQTLIGGSFHLLRTTVTEDDGITPLKLAYRPTVARKIIATGRSELEARA